MAKADTTTAAARAPRGAKPAAQAFLDALDSVPEAARSAVVKAAQVMIRDELKNRREKLKTSTPKKARRPAAAKRGPKTSAPEVAEPVAATPAKRRSRKQASAAA